MLSFASDPSLPYDGLFFDRCPIAWAACNSSKPGRRGNTWVVHASPDWTRTRLNAHAEAIAAELTSALATHTGMDPTAVTGQSAYRWLYSLAENPLGAGALWEPDLGLTVCGDWCQGARIEGAYLSGQTAAGRVLSHLAGETRAAEAGKPAHTANAKSLGCSGNQVSMFHRLEENHSMPWAHRGQRRPAFAIDPGPGQESVWDYPRPPRLVADPRRVEVRIGESLLARSSHAFRVLETASPPTFYLPRADVRMELLRRTTGHSACEWKGKAIYFDAIDDRRIIERAAWSYESPMPPFSAIAGYLSFYPGRVTCTVDGEWVRPQPGAFYGGWVTDEIVGPYKGEAGTGGW